MTMAVISKLGICALSGVIFGVALEKGRVFEPMLIREQMVMGKFVMLKMFLSAVTTGLLSLSVLSMLPATKDSFDRASNSFYRCLRGKGLVASALGGGILGMGMTLSGACPGMVLAQVGAGTTHAVYTLLGALTGTFLYAVIRPIVEPVLQSESVPPMNPYKDSPLFAMSLPLVAMFGMIVFAVELLIPWRNEVKVRAASNFFLQRAWPPYISGALIGFLQIPIVLAVEDTIGGSSAYATVVAQAMVGPLENVSSYLKSRKRGVENWWQVFYVGGAIVGGYLSATASNTYGATKGVPIPHAFIGGALMALGARIAGGCTSGHGISGMGLMSIMSLIATGSMFGGAMGTAVLMKSMGILSIN